MKNLTFLFTYTTLSLMIVSTMVFGAFAVPVEKAEAGGGGLATETTQLLNKAELSLSAVKNTITASATSITAGATTAMFTKENLLDGIGWAIAKQMVSSMTRSLINWINSGFQGAPAFITDLKVHLLKALDSVAGEYIKSLGGIGEFICSPFKLDVQAALYINYEQARSGMPSGPSACTLSGIGDNIEGFLDGGISGWDQWFKVTANPQNTPYGAYLEAEAKLNARLVNEAGKEIELANWGDGFLSKKVCEPVTGGGQKCSVSTPGKVISEALTFQLSTGPRTLIEADEINEIIGALMNQLVQKAVSGINGLLGLGGNSSYSDDSYGDTGDQSYLDAMEQEGIIDTENVRRQFDEQLTVEQSYLTLINQTITDATAVLGTIPTDPSTLSDPDDIAAYNIYIEAVSLRPEVMANIATLNGLISEYDSAAPTTNGSSTVSVDNIEQEIVLQYSELYQAGIFSNQSEVEQARADWTGTLEELE